MLRLCTLAVAFSTDSPSPGVISNLCHSWRGTLRANADIASALTSSLSPRATEFMRRSSGGASRKDHRARARRGLTLIEMLVATAITLLMMAAVATIFDQFGRSVNDSRATVEMSARLRDVRIRLQNDLDGLTTSPVPWLRPEADPGYLEIDEGARTDQSPTLLVLSADSSLLPTNDRTPQADFDSAYGLSGLGDADDILMMTVRSTGAPFTGRALASDGTRTVVQSQVAEVFWYAVENPADGSGGEPGLRTLYRRVLLVLPTKDAGLLTAANTPAPLDEMEFYRNFDVSAHRDENGLWAPNTLGDLTKRENRFAHDPGVGAFPHPLNTLPIRGGVDGSPHYTSSGTLRPFGSYEPHLDGPWAPRASVGWDQS